VFVRVWVCGESVSLHLTVANKNGLIKLIKILLLLHAVRIYVLLLSRRLAIFGEQDLCPEGCCQAGGGGGYNYASSRSRSRRANDNTINKVAPPEMCIFILLLFFKYENVCLLAKQMDKWLRMSSFWAAFTVERLLTLPCVALHCIVVAIEWNGLTQLQWWNQLADCCPRSDPGTDRFSCIFHVAFKYSRNGSMLNKILCDNKNLSATHAQDSQSQSGLCTLYVVRFSPWLSLLIFLRLSIYGNFLCSNIKNNKGHTHSSCNQVNSSFV